MPTAPTAGEVAGHARTTYQVASNILTITAYPRNYEGALTAPPVDQVTTMKVIYDETNLDRASDIARENRDRALMESDRHDAIMKTIRTLAKEKKDKREAEEAHQHEQDRVAEEIFGGSGYGYLSPNGMKAVDEIIKLRAELDKKGTK